MPKIGRMLQGQACFSMACFLVTCGMIVPGVVLFRRVFFVLNPLAIFSSGVLGNDDTKACGFHLLPVVPAGAAPKYTEYLARWEGIIKENENCFRQEGKYNIRKFVRERELFASFRK